MNINESYATDMEADDYLEYTPNTESWFDLTDDEKEALLVTATRMIDRLKMKYESVDVDQELKFPVNTGDSTDTGLDQAKEANILQAYYIHQNADELTEAQGNRIQGIKTQTMPKIGQTASGYNPITMISPEALQIMAPYVDLTIRAVR